MNKVSLIFVIVILYLEISEMKYCKLKFLTLTFKSQNLIEKINKITYESIEKRCAD